jgi:tetratricopeptide (TPR) repeat protein
MLKAVRGTGGPNHNDLINAAMAGDSERVEEMWALWDTLPAASINLGFPVYVAEWAGDFPLAERFARRQARSTNALAPRLAGHVNLARLLVAHGQWRAASAELRAATELDGARARTMRAALATLPFLAVPREDLVSIVEEVQAWTPAAAEPGSPPERAYDQHMRLYFLGALASKLGDATAALEYADAIEALADEAQTAVPGDLATTIRADVSWRQGDTPQEAIRALEALRGHVPAVFWEDPVFGQEHARYIRASVLLSAGEFEESLRWLDNGLVVTPGWVYYLGPVAYLRAQALEASGRTDEAGEARAAYRELWADADAEIASPRR